jgi:Cation transport ATPase
MKCCVSGLQWTGTARGRLAAAIVSAADKKGLALSPTTDFTSVTGKGAKALVDGRIAAVGNAKLVREMLGRAGQLKAMTTMNAICKPKAIRVMYGDRRRPYCRYHWCFRSDQRIPLPNAVKRLKHLGVHIVMLTGDNKTTAGAVAKIARTGRFRG